MARQLKKNDTVVVIAGAQKGKRGRLLRVDHKAGRVVVEGVNVRKKAQRRSADNPQGGITSIECPVHVSNVMLEEVYNSRHPEGSSAADQKAADAKAPAES
jgi:large subunit ribosomal protein L24